MTENITEPNPSEELIRNFLKDYPGYVNPSDRVISDESLRGHIIQVMETFLQQTESLTAYLASNALDDLAERTRRIEQDLELLIDKVQITPYSYSLFFTSYQISQDTYDRIIQNDLAMIKLSQDINKILEPTLSPTTNFHALVDTLEELILTLNEQIETRYGTIIEFQG
jgi:hypothetical protein